MVLLNGDSFDLENLEFQLNSPIYGIIKEDGLYYLSSTEFSNLTDAVDVYKHASELLKAINGAAKLTNGNFRSVSLGNTVKGPFDEAGNNTGGINIFLESAEVRAIMLPPKVIIDGEEQRLSTDLEQWLGLSQNDENIRRALRIYGAFEHNWDNLNKILEVISSDVGKVVTKNGWASESQIRNFKHTANSLTAAGDEARHGSIDKSPPKNPMSKTEAKCLITTILEKWLAYKREL